MRDHDYWVYILTNKHRTTLYVGMTMKGWLRRRKDALIEETNPNWLDLSADWADELKPDIVPWDTEEMVRDSSLRSE